MHYQAGATGANRVAQCDGTTIGVHLVRIEAQAIDRTHRIGQTQTVIAYRLIVKGSIEEKIRELQKAKSMMAGDTLGEDRFNHALTLDDFRFLFDSAEAAL